MSLFVLDTDVLSLLQRGHAVVGQRVAAHPPADLALTVITAEEQVSGRIASIRNARGRAQVAIAYGLLAQTIHFLGAWPLLELTEPAINRFDSAARPAAERRVE